MAHSPEPLIEPVSDLDPARVQAAFPERYPHLLDSASGGPQGRFDILMACPEGRIERRVGDGGDFLAQLDGAWRAERLPEGEGGLPFQGGWFLFLGYELAADIEPVLDIPLPAPGELIAFAERCPAALVRDRAEGRSWLVAEAGRSDCLATLRADVEAARALDPPLDLPAVRLNEETPERYLQSVARALDYIRDGDIFQANLSRLWQGTCPQAAAIALYQSLRRHNPGPFNGLSLHPEQAIVSSSPERLVRVRQGEISTRPIAGTRPRGADSDGDARLSRELLAHPKERAEHVMLIDLERNDLGRVSEYGSVEVDELMVLEHYAHVHHIVSNVRGRLRPEVTPGGVIRALFPGGTITGCPKVRCMQIIGELEGAPRRAYTGSMGYLNRDGSLDLNILIRTLELANGRLRLRAGAGVVADSRPEWELEETRAKARGLLLALGA